MKNALIRIGCLASALGLLSEAKAQGYGFAIDQLQELPPYFSSFMNEYTRDVNENINSGFFFATQTSARALKKGEFELGINAGGSFVDPRQANRDISEDLPSNRYISFSNTTPSLFGTSEPSFLTFQFRDPDSGNPLVNPYTGEQVSLQLEVPAGLGLGYGATPSASISGGFGIGLGTELKAYVTPSLLSLVSGDEENISFTKDFAYGVQFKHDITYWIPKLQDKGVHIAFAGGYGSYQLEVNPNLLSEPFVSNFTDDISIVVSDNIENVAYNLSTYSARLMVGKTFKLGEITLSGGYSDNTYEMISTGGLNISITDESGQTANEQAELNNLIDFAGSNTNWGYGAALTLGKGWFRTALSYRRANNHFAAISFQFHINHKKDRPTNYRDYRVLNNNTKKSTTDEN